MIYNKVGSIKNYITVIKREAFELFKWKWIHFETMLSENKLHKQPYHIVSFT